MTTPTVTITRAIMRNDASQGDGLFIRHCLQVERRRQLAAGQILGKGTIDSRPVYSEMASHSG